MIANPIHPNLCFECSKLDFSRVMGDGSCEKHGRYAYYKKFRSEQCIKCAIEKNICQECNRKLYIKQLLFEHLPRIEELCRPFYYPLFWNDDLEQKTEAYPQGNFIYEIDKKIVGYIYSHPYIYDKEVSLSEKLIIPQNPNCCYIHDVCIDKDFHRRGIATELIKHVINLNLKNFKTFALVSVLDTHQFYEKLGFKIVREIKYNDQKAFYMSLTI